MRPPFPPPDPGRAAPPHTSPLAICVAALLLVPASLAGQSGPLPDAGTLGLGFGLLDHGDGTVTVRRMMSQTTSLGLGVSFDLSGAEETGPMGSASRTRRSVGLHPDLRFYRTGGGRVVPFAVLSTRFGYADDDGPGSSWSVGGGVGVGAEWFPVRGVSVAGSAGIQAGYGRSDTGATIREGWSVGTLRSAVGLTLYF